MRRFLWFSLVGGALVVSSCTLENPDAPWFPCSDAIENNGNLAGYFDSDYIDIKLANQDLNEYHSGMCKSGVFNGCFPVPGKEKVYACSKCEQEWMLTCGSGGKCVDVRQNPEHCGRCDHACGQNQQCVDGACVSSGTVDTEKCTKNFCKDGNLHVCLDDGRIDIVECQFGCENEACISKDQESGKCDRDVCVDAFTLLECHEDGTTNVNKCENGCVDGICKQGSSDPEVCAENQYFDENLKKCVCNTQEHWIEKNDICVCDVNYNNINGKCEVDKSCGKRAGEIFDENTYICICDTKNNWSGEANACHCKDGYILNNDNVCVVDTKCGDRNGEIYDKIKNKCVCDTDRKWSGESGNCICSGTPFYGECIQQWDIVSFGSFPQKSDKTIVPIKWIVYQTNQDSIRLLALNVLEWKKYHDIADTTSWQKSSLHEWLNQDFLSTAFSSDEKLRMRAVERDSVNGTNMCNKLISSDKVFLMNVDEANQLKRDFLIAAPTEYVFSQVGGQGSISESAAKYWLQNTTFSACNPLMQAFIIGADGDMVPKSYDYINNANSTNSRFGVRPMISVNADK